MALNGDKMVFETGSGEYPRGIDLGYWHSDIRYPLPHQELCCDLRALPFKDCSLDGLSIMHALEHISWREIPDVVSRIYRVLKPGGFVVVVSPNLLWCAMELQSLSVEDSTFESRWENLMQEIYCLHNFPDNHHKSGFTPAFLRKIFAEAGFSTVKTPREECSGNIEIWGYK